LGFVARLITKNKNILTINAQILEVIYVLNNLFSAVLYNILILLFFGKGFGW